MSFRKMISTGLFYLTVPFIYLGSILPFPVLYLISDVLFVILYHIWGYRRKIVQANLKHAFPEKSEIEIKKLERAFYKYLCDLFLETFKMLTISSQSMLKRCRLDSESQKLLNELSAEEESTILTLGHKGNWEWAGSTFSLVCRQSFQIVYHPLSHPGFDKIMYKMRSRFGARLMTMSNAFKVLKQLNNTTMITAFVADQAPPLNGAYWTPFMHQETPFFRGPERISNKLSQSVLYLSISRIRRGYYTMHVERIASRNETFTDGEITSRYVRVLEQDILSQPQTWLWSHRRWKHSKPAANSSLLS